MSEKPRIDLDKKARSTPHVIDLDTWARPYERILRALRVARGLVASTAYFPFIVIIGMAIIPLVFMSDRLNDPPSVLHVLGVFGFVMALLVAAVVIYFFAYRGLVAGNMVITRIILGLSWLLFLIVVVLLCFDALTTDRIAVIVADVVSLALYLCLFLVFIPGLHTLVRRRSSPEFETFFNRYKSKSIRSDIARVMGLWLPVGMEPKRRRAVIGFAVAAFVFEGAGFRIYLSLPGKVNERVEDAGFLAIGLAILAIVWVPFMFWLARKANRKSRRLALESAGDLREQDTRPPILFLRMFRDDQVSLLDARVPPVLLFLDPSAIAHNLDEMIVREFTDIGPVIALGNPEDKEPPIGSARQYVDGERWREVFTSLIDEAAYIVVGVHETDNIFWELETLKSRAYLGKTMLVWPPTLGDNLSLVQKVETLLGLDLLGALACPGPAAARKRANDHKSAIGLVYSPDLAPLFFVANEVTEMAYELALRVGVLRLLDYDILRLACQSAGKGSNERGI